MVKPKLYNIVPQLVNLAMGMVNEILLIANLDLQGFNMVPLVPWKLFVQISSPSNQHFD